MRGRLHNGAYRVAELYFQLDIKVEAPRAMDLTVSNPSILYLVSCLSCSSPTPASQPPWLGLTSRRFSYQWAPLLITVLILSLFLWWLVVYLPHWTIAPEELTLDLQCLPDFQAHILPFYTPFCNVSLSLPINRWSLFPSPWIWAGLVTSLTSRMVDAMLWDMWVRPQEALELCPDTDTHQDFRPISKAILDLPF